MYRSTQLYGPQVVVITKAIIIIYIYVSEKTTFTQIEVYMSDFQIHTLLPIYSYRLNIG